eukprot:SAG11_NODE_4588_length_1841_cov_1.874856_2_plen_157_part_00
MHTIVSGACAVEGLQPTRIAVAAVPQSRQHGRTALVAKSALETAHAVAIVRARQLLALACTAHSRLAVGRAASTGRWGGLLRTVARHVAAHKVRHTVVLRCDAEWEAKLEAAASAREAQKRFGQSLETAERLMALVQAEDSELQLALELAAVVGHR